MRDLADIIEACKLNERPSIDELRYALKVAGVKINGDS